MRNGQSITEPPSAVTHISQKSVPKSRFLTASPSREKPLVGISTWYRFMEQRWIRDKASPPRGRSCQKKCHKALFLTDVGVRRKAAAVFVSIVMAFPAK